MCREIRRLGCVTRALGHAQFMQPSPRIFLHFCMSHWPCRAKREDNGFVESNWAFSSQFHSNDDKSLEIPNFGWASNFRSGGREGGRAGFATSPPPRTRELNPKAIKSLLHRLKIPRLPPPRAPVSFEKIRPRLDSHIFSISTEPNISPHACASTRELFVIQLCYFWNVHA